MEGLIGKDYRATVRLSDTDDVTLANVGETCERVPEASLGWLLEQRLIAPVAVVTETAVAAPVETRAEGTA